MRPAAAYLIVGTGKFGRLAAVRLRAQDPGARFTMVDHNPQALETVKTLAPEAQAVVGDGPAFLASRLADLGRWDFILPCVPLHLAFAALRLGPLAPPAWELTAVPAALEQLAAVARRGSDGELYLSRATHLCPDDCDEPEVCPVDGLPRRPGLGEVLAGFHLPGWEVRVIISRLLAPGVGGFLPQALAALATRPETLPRRLALATACCCHAVVHGARRKEDAVT